MRTIRTLAALALLAAATTSAWAEGCSLSKGAEKDAQDLSPALLSSLQASLTAAQADECSSLATVVSAAAKGKRGPGRALEDDKPLNVALAKADLDAAMQDAEIRGRLERIRQDVKDENARLLYEAAVLDSAEHYDARDLLVQQVRQQLGKK